jgi:hypothetical protein
MGEVYRARDPSQNRDFAIKVLRPIVLLTTEGDTAFCAKLLS